MDHDDKIEHAKETLAQIAINRQRAKETIEFHKPIQPNTDRPAMFAWLHNQEHMRA